MGYMRVYGTTDARKYLKISEQYFLRLVQEHKIPFQKTSSGRIFFEPDLIRFKNQRITKAKIDKRVRP